MATGELRVVHMGLVEYRRALALQADLRERRQADEIGDTLLLLEHPPVFTRGRRSDASDLPMGEAWYLSQGMDVVQTDRGGKLTYHGPGQLVGYPIMRADSPRRFVEQMQRAIVTVLREVGFDARTRDEEGTDYIGVWIQDRKIASVGVHLAKGVTTHGFAINVRNDLQPFTYVVACGLPEVQMTSAVKENGTDPGEEGLAALADRLAEVFAAEHGLRAVPGTEALPALS